MTRIGAFSTSTAKRVWNATQEVEKQLDESGSLLGQRSDVVLFQNTSGHVIPPFGLMQIDEFEMDGTRPIHKVIRPFTASDTASVFLVNGRDEVAVNKFSSAQTGPVFRVKSSETDAGIRIGWGTDTFEADLGCLLITLGPDSEEGVVRAMADFSVLTGVVSTLIPANGAGTGIVNVGGVSHKAKTLKGEIATTKDVIMWPREGEWLALEVC